MKNTKAEKNLPGTYKLVVTCWDGQINGFRPRPIWSEISYEELDKWGRELAAEVVTYRKQEAIRNRISRNLRRAQHRAWVEKKRSYFTPKTTTVGDVVKF